MKNKIRMNDNKLKSSELTLNGEDFLESEDYVLRNVKVNYLYEHGQKTEFVDSISYSCVDPITFNSVTFKVNTTKPVIEQKVIDSATENIYIAVPITEAVIRIYKIEFGLISVSITVPYVKLSEN